MDIETTDDAAHRVLLLHGIRDQGVWQDMIAKTVGEPGKVKVVPIGYGYLPVWGLLIPGLSRWLAVHTVLKRVRGAIAALPDKNDRVSVIAHSFGSYAITRILEQNEEIEIQHLVMCGAIVRRQYNWGRVRRQIKGRIINDYGTLDHWPVAAGAVTWGYGDTGTYGAKAGETVIDRAHRIGHSDFLTEEFAHDFWRTFFVEGTIADGALIKSGEKPSPSWFGILGWPWRWPLAALQVLLVALVLTWWPHITVTIEIGALWVQEAIVRVIDMIYPERDPDLAIQPISVTGWGSQIVVTSGFHSSSSIDLARFAQVETPHADLEGMRTGTTSSLIPLGDDFMYDYALLAIWRNPIDAVSHCTAYVLFNLDAAMVGPGEAAVDGEYYSFKNAAGEELAKIGVRDGSWAFTYASPGEAWSAGRPLSDALPAVEETQPCAAPFDISSILLPSAISIPMSFN